MIIKSLVTTLLRCNIIILLGVLLAFSGCGNSGGSDSPANSVKDFVKAVKEGNPGKAWAFLSDNSKNQFDEAAKETDFSGKEIFLKDFRDARALGNLFEDFEVIDERKEGETAKVTLRFTSGKTVEVNSIKEGGAWKYDLTRPVKKQ